MKTLIIALCALATATATLAGELSVTGRGTVLRKADKMVISFEVSARDKDLEKAKELFIERRDSLATVFAAAGIATNDIVALGIDMERGGGSSSSLKFSGPFRGFTVSESYMFAAKFDRAQLEKINSALLTCKAIENLRVEFDLFDRAPAKEEARRLAVENAKDVAFALAYASNVILGEIAEISYENRSRVDTPDTAQQDVEITETVDMKWKIRD